MTIPVGGPFYVYSYQELGVPEPNNYSITVHEGSAVLSRKRGGSNEDEEPRALGKEIWRSVAEGYAGLRGKNWAPAQEGVGGTRVTIRNQVTDIYDVGYSAWSGEKDLYAAIEGAVASVKALFGER